jgi:hypothetical protein
MTKHSIIIPKHINKKPIQESKAPSLKDILNSKQTLKKVNTVPTEKSTIKGPPSLNDILASRSNLKKVETCKTKIDIENEDSDDDDPMKNFSNFKKRLIKCFW